MPDDSRTRDQRFGRVRRLLTAAEYQRVFNSNPGKSVDHYFTVLAVQSETETARLGLVVARRNARRAVDRNRIKRLIRESFRLHRLELPPLDIVVLARHAARQADNSTLFGSLKRHWLYLSRICAKYSSP